MICAKEYMNIKTVAEKEEEIRRLQFEEEKREWLANIHSYTKEFCDTILNQMLIENAQNNKIETVLWVSNIKDFTYRIWTCGFVYEGKTHYANGEKSFVVDYDNVISFNFLSEYLTEHCFEIKTRPHNFKSYGYGERDGYDIIITPQPSCE